MMKKKKKLMQEMVHYHENLLQEFEKKYNWNLKRENYVKERKDYWEKEDCA
jgi:hypothetical protein